MSLKKDIQELTQRTKQDYINYKDEIKLLVENYENKRNSFNAKIGVINSSRHRFKESLDSLYDFLCLIGKNMREITPFDFEEEDLYKYQVFDEFQPLEEPDYKKIKLGSALFGITGVVVDTTFVHFKNKKKYSEHYTDVENRKSEYDNDIQKRKDRIASLEDAIKIADLYRINIDIVSEIVKKKIIPELDVIQAFLYADAIREKLLDGDNPEKVRPASISEYKGTKQDIHYQFVVNVFDFYTLCSVIFKQKILTKILEDNIITEEERTLFEQQINSIKSKIQEIESKKVI